MNRSLHHAAFALGLLAIAWVGAGYLPDNPLALALVLLIGAAYLAGALELHRHQQATAGLARLLDEGAEPPSGLGPWLERVPPGLQHAVRLRVEGERVALPGPALTPTLVGLLVLLGMLGTFLGMVVTLRGTGLALANATDVAAIRSLLAAPVQGLGLAFGCSIAGVAASAMLGLMSALARRERQAVARQLDARIASTLRALSPRQQRAAQDEAQRDEMLRLLRVQTELMSATLPALATQLQALGTQTALGAQAAAAAQQRAEALAERSARQAAEQAQALADHLLAAQARFHDAATLSATALAASVGQSLQASLAEGARLAEATLGPAVQSTLAGLARESASLQAGLAAAVQRQIDAVGASLAATQHGLAQGWQAALAAQQGQAEAANAGLQAGLDAFAQRFEQRSAALLERLDDGFAQRSATLLQEVAAAQAAQQAASAAQERERLAAHAASLAAMQAAAAEAPRAAAEVIAELRAALSDSLVRDNAALDERNRLLATLGQLLDTVSHAGTEQRAAIDALVEASRTVLERTGSRFAESVETGTSGLQALAAQLNGSAAEMAGLGEGFGAAVQLFSRSSEQLLGQLQRIEAALGQSLARSDEQLAYYVAQAREIVELTLGSHKQIVDELQQLAPAARTAPRAAAPEAVAAA